MNNRDIAKLIDAPTYEGKPCKPFGHTLKSTQSGLCVACQRLAKVTIKRDPTFYEKKVKKQASAEYHKAYSLKHRVKMAKTNKDWFADPDNKKRRAEYMREYRARLKQKRLDRIYADRIERRNKL